MVERYRGLQYWKDRAAELEAENRALRKTLEQLRLMGSEEARKHIDKTLKGEE